MAERIHEKLSKKLKESVGQLGCNTEHTYTNPQELIIILASEMPKDKDKAISEFTRNHSSRQHWSYHMQSNHKMFLQYKNYAEAWHNNEKQILNIERKAARMTLFYRVMTTIFVGFTIMGIYAVAHRWGVPMPLMRMPV